MKVLGWIQSGQVSEKRYHPTRLCMADLLNKAFPQHTPIQTPPASKIHQISMNGYSVLVGDISLWFAIVYRQRMWWILELGLGWCCHLHLGIVFVLARVDVLEYALRVLGVVYSNLVEPPPTLTFLKLKQNCEGFFYFSDGCWKQNHHKYFPELCFQIFVTNCLFPIPSPRSNKRFSLSVSRTRGAISAATCLFGSFATMVNLQRHMGCQPILAITSEMGDPVSSIASLLDGSPKLSTLSKSKWRRLQLQNQTIRSGSNNVLFPLKPFKDQVK